jgi:hypothetical protein
MRYLLKAEGWRLQCNEVNVPLLLFGVFSMSIYSIQLYLSLCPSMIKCPYRRVYNKYEIKPDLSERARQASCCKDLTDRHASSNASALHRVSAFHACFHHMSNSFGAAFDACRAAKHPRDPIGTEAPAMPPFATCYRVSRTALKHCSMQIKRSHELPRMR